MVRPTRIAAFRRRGSRTLRWKSLLALLLGTGSAAAAQAPETAAPDSVRGVVVDSLERVGSTAELPPTVDAVAPEGLRVFLDCKAPCDFSYIIRNTPFVSYVRDQKAAEVYVLITQQWTGSGGRSFRLEYQGREKFNGQQQQLSFISPQSSTADEQRRGLTQVLKLGLISYAAQTPLAARLDVAYTEADGAAPPRRAADPWNNWVFRVGAGGALNREATRSATRMNGSFSADRVTSEWKLRTAVHLDYDERDFRRQGQVISSSSHRVDTNASMIRSLGPRWSFGLFGQAYSASFTNVGLGLRMSPALEYNIFPWDISDRKEFTISYTLGVRSFQYMEETIYGKMAETLPFESLRSSLRFTQPWGSMWANLEGSHYIQDLEKYRLQLNTNLSVRLFKGLSLEVGGRAESIHDQLYLPRGDASLEEILLQQRRLATTYEIATHVGLRYTFGSIYNSVVNPRF